MPFQAIPRQLAFFGLLDDAAGNVAAASGELLALVDDLSNAGKYAEAIRDREAAGDELTHRIAALVNTTFVVPIDRHDLHHLASGLDDVLDYMDGVADLLQQLHLAEMFPWFRILVEVLARTCGAQVRAVGHLQQLGSIGTDVATIKRLEREGDWVYRRAVADLYAGDNRPLEVLMWKHLLLQVEEAIDRCEDVASQIQSVAAKYA